MKHTHLHEENVIKNTKMLWISFITSFSLFVAKISIGFFSNSKSMIASSLDSAMDSLSTVINIFIFKEASKPADKEHPFGHGKYEAFAGFIQSILIITGGSALLMYSLVSLSQPFQPTETNNTFELLGIAVMIVSSVSPLVLSYFMKKRSTDSKSQVMNAEHAHFLTDGVMNVGVLAGLLLSYFFEVYWIDSIIAIAIAFWIIWEAKELFLTNFKILTDTELSKNIQNEIKNILKKHIKEEKILGWHDLRTRQSGMDYHIDVHLEFPDIISLYNAHEISEIIEEDIRKKIPNAILLTHFDLHSEYLQS